MNGLPFQSGNYQRVSRNFPILLYRRVELEINIFYDYQLIILVITIGMYSLLNSQSICLSKNEFQEKKMNKAKFIIIIIVWKS